MLSEGYMHSPGRGNDRLPSERNASPIHCRTLTARRDRVTARREARRSPQGEAPSTPLVMHYTPPFDWQTVKLEKENAVKDVGATGASGSETTTAQHSDSAPTQVQCGDDFETMRLSSRDGRRKHVQFDLSVNTVHNSTSRLED